MIGKIHFDDGGRPMVATLEDDGRWTCPESFYADDLNAVLAIVHYSPADGRRGWLHLKEAAKRYEGTVEVDDPGPPTPGLMF